MLTGRRSPSVPAALTRFGRDRSNGGPDHVRAVYTPDMRPYRGKVVLTIVAVQESAVEKSHIARLFL